LSFSDICLTANDPELNLITAIRNDDIITVVKSNGDKTDSYIPLLFDNEGIAKDIRDALKKKGLIDPNEYELRLRDAAIERYCKETIITYGDRSKRKSYSV